MASSLEKFLAIEPETIKTETCSVAVKGGQVLEVDVKGLTLNQFKSIKKKSTDTYDNARNGGAPAAQIEELTFAQKLCAQGIIDPPMTNAKLREKFHVHSNELLVEAMFPPPSIMKLGSVIVRLTLGDKVKDDEIEISSGTDREKIEEAKN